MKKHKLILGILEKGDQEKRMVAILEMIASQSPRDRN